MPGGLDEYEVEVLADLQRKIDRAADGVWVSSAPGLRGWPSERMKMFGREFDRVHANAIAEESAPGACASWGRWRGCQFVRARESRLTKRLDEARRSRDDLPAPPVPVMPRTGVGGCASWASRQCSPLLGAGDSALVRPPTSCRRQGRGGTVESRSERPKSRARSTMS